MKCDGLPRERPQTLRGTPIFAALVAVTSLSTATEPRQSALCRVQSKGPVSGLLGRPYFSIHLAQLPSELRNGSVTAVKSRVICGGRGRDGVT